VLSASEGKAPMPHKGFAPGSPGSKAPRPPFLPVHFKLTFAAYGSCPLWWYKASWCRVQMLMLLYPD